MHRHITNVPACIEWLSGVSLPDGFHLYPGVQVLDWNRYKEFLIADLRELMERRGRADMPAFTPRYYTGVLQQDIYRILDIVGIPDEQAEDILYEQRGGFRVISEAPL